MDKILKIANLYVATLRAIYLIHQHNHWQARGDSFYGTHLLFERLYKSAAEDADSAAEKMIGLFGESGVDFDQQQLLINKIMGKYASFDGNSVKMSLEIEQDFLQLSKEAYSAFETENALSLGLDDLIMSIASNREEACYLLKQTIKS